jgi:hypothetical protein
MRRLENYVKKYGPVAGPMLFRTLQSQAAHASVSARLRKKIGMLEGRIQAPARVSSESYPLFEGVAEEEGQLVA